MAPDNDNPHAMIALVIKQLQRIQEHPCLRGDGPSSTGLRLQDEKLPSPKRPGKETLLPYRRRVNPPDLSKAEQLYNLALVHGESRPFAQFKSQAARESVRLEYQREQRRYGRRQTLPWDDRLSYLQNAENNVRARWVEQGIWAEEWGPAWNPELKSHYLSVPISQRNGPFCGRGSPTSLYSAVITRWGHESPTPVVEGTPLGFRNSKPIACLYDSDNAFVSPPVEVHLPPRPVVRNLEASRPYLQFLYQLSKERQWLEDEWHCKPPGTSLDRENAVYESVRDNWIEDGTWNYDWDALPGSRWPYEGLHPVVRDPTLTRVFRRNQHHGLKTISPFEKPWHRPSPIPVFHTGNLPEEQRYTNASVTETPPDEAPHGCGLFGRRDEEYPTTIGANDTEIQPNKTEQGSLFGATSRLSDTETWLGVEHEPGLFGRYRVVPGTARVRVGNTRISGAQDTETQPKEIQPGGLFGSANMPSIAETRPNNVQYGSSLFGRRGDEEYPMTIGDQDTDTQSGDVFSFGNMASNAEPQSNKTRRGSGEWLGFGNTISHESETIEGVGEDPETVLAEDTETQTKKQSQGGHLAKP